MAEVKSAAQVHGTQQVSRHMSFIIPEVGAAAEIQVEYC